MLIFMHIYLCTFYFAVISHYSSWIKHSLRILTACNIPAFDLHIYCKWINRKEQLTIGIGNTILYDIGCLYLLAVRGRYLKPPGQYVFETRVPCARRGKATEVLWCMEAKKCWAYIGDKNHCLPQVRWTRFRKLHGERTAVSNKTSRVSTELPSLS